MEKDPSPHSYSEVRLEDSDLLIATSPSHHSATQQQHSVDQQQQQRQLLQHQHPHHLQEQLQQQQQQHPRHLQDHQSHQQQQHHSHPDLTSQELQRHEQFLVRTDHHLPLHQQQQQHHLQQQLQQQHRHNFSGGEQQVLAQNVLHAPDLLYVDSASTPYGQHDAATAAGQSDAATYEAYTNEHQALISDPQDAATMRTGRSGRGRILEEGSGRGGGAKEGSGSKRGWKRKRGEGLDDGDSNPPHKMDPSHRCDVCGEQASGHYFGALVCLPCKSFFIRCTKDGAPNFSNQCGGKCDILRGGRVKCQHCRFQKCIIAGMYRKEKPEAVEPGEGQMLCKVCGDIANGVHFGVTTCEGCKKFFRRGLKEHRSYTCKGSMRCSINPRMRNNCRYCRYQKCLFEGMSREAIKMGRPKKGEVLRKPLKKNGLRHDVKEGYGHQRLAGSNNRSSLSSELTNEGVSSSSEAFNHVASQQLHNLQPGQLQQQQQQGSGEAADYSLGTILHDGMTVQDWDQGGEVVDAHGMILSSSGQPGSGVMKHDPEMLTQEQALALQYQRGTRGQPIQIDGHYIQSQQPPSRQMTPFQESQELKNSPGGNPEILTGIDFSSDHDLPVNRAVKVEDSNHQPGETQPSYYSGEPVVLADMPNVQPLNKAEFTNFKFERVRGDGSSSSPVPVYTVDEHHSNTASNNATPSLLPISQLEPSVRSQIVAINMSSESVVYTPHSHEQLVVQNGGMPGVIHDPSLENHFAGQARRAGVPFSVASSNPNLVQQQGTIVSQFTATSTMDNKDSGVYGKIETSAYQPQYMSEPGIVSTEELHMVSSRGPVVASPHSVIQESPYTNQSPSHAHGQQQQQQNLRGMTQSGQTSLPSNISGPQLPLQIPLSARSSVMAILQQHKDDIQAGRPVQLSSEEIEELLNTVNTEEARAQVFKSEQQNTQHHTVIQDEQTALNLRRQDQQSLLHERQQGEYLQQGTLDAQRGGSFRRQQVMTPPVSLPNNRSPGTAGTRVASRQSYSSLPSPVSSPALEERLPQRPHSNIGVSTVYSGMSNGNDSSQQGGHEQDMVDDSFNSYVIRDSTLLHEINRIFLGIDNSCETYGCTSRSQHENLSHEELTAMMIDLSPDIFATEISHRYWHSIKPSREPVVMTAERQKTIQEVLGAFENLQKTYYTNEPEYLSRKLPSDQIDHWHHIQRRIARHVVAGQRFCRNIPGYFRLDLQDRISLGKHVGFGLMVLTACTEFYDPEFKRFRYIWNWTIPMQNPLFSYKVHLLSLGDRIHECQVDQTEAAMLCAISMTSIDCPGLDKPNIVLVIRDALIDALEAHIYAKTKSTERLTTLLAIMPQVRLMTLWYNNLMKKMSLPSDLMKLSRRPEQVNNADNTADASS